MAIIDKYDAVRRALVAAKQINDRAVMLRNWSGSIPFRELQQQLDAMRSYYLTHIQPVLDLGTAAQVNSVIGTFFAGSLPASSYAAMQNIGTALLAFYQAYDVVFDTITPITFAPATGHVYEDIPLSQLATLADELDAVIAAAAPLI